VAHNRNNEARDTYDQRLNRVLQAATELIARDGYERTSVRSVARAAEVSLAGLYHYFDSKQRMLFLIQFRTFNSLVSRLREKLHGITDPLERLRIMIRAHVDYFAANMAALKVCSHELDSLSGQAYAETRRLRREYYQLARSVVDELFASRGVNQTLDPHVATMALFGMLNWLYRWYVPKPGLSPTTLANQLATLFLHGVLGGAGAHS